MTNELPAGVKNLKFVQVHTFYGEYLNDFHSKNPNLPCYDDKIRGLIKDGFSAIHIFGPALQSYGYTSHLIIANDPLTQCQWLGERNLKIHSAENWMYEIVRLQLAELKPDVLYLSDPILFDGKFIRSLDWRPELILGWKASDVPEGTDWNGFDVMLSCLEGMKELAFRLGARACEPFLPGFPEWMLERVGDVEPRYDVVFCGQWNIEQYRLRNDYLRVLCRLALKRESGLSLGFYLSGNPASMPPEIIKCNLGGRYGVAMHRALRSGRIGFDARGEIRFLGRGGQAVNDLARRETANMRIFETTGMGVFLLTEHFDNIAKFFEIGTEIETYKDPRDLLDKVRYYTSHADERERIAKRGQARCLREHGMKRRAGEFDRLIRKYLAITK